MLRPTEPLDRVLPLVFVVLFMLNLGQGPVGAPGSARFVALALLALSVIVASRNINVAALALLALNITFRLQHQVSHWADQVFVQNFGLSSLLSGVNIYSGDNLAGSSFAYYLPMGSLFGSLPIYVGLENYWDFYHVLVPLLLMVPFVHSRSMANLAIFVVSAFFFPLADYTTGGGNVELSYVFLIPGIYLLLNDRNSTSAVILLAFGLMLRQPSVFLIPFVFLALMRRGELREAWSFVALLAVAGGWYFIQDPGGFFKATFAASAGFQEIWYRRHGGLGNNFSVSTVLQYLGIGDPWRIDNRLYLAGMLACNAVLTVTASIAHFRGAIGVKSYLAVGILTAVLVYFLARGFVFLHYLMSVCFVFLAFWCTPAPAAPGQVRHAAGWAPPLDAIASTYTRALAGIVAVLIAFPLLAALTHSAKRPGGDPLKAAFYFHQARDAAGTPVEFRPAGAGISFPVGSSLAIELERPAAVESITLVGERFGPADIEGVKVSVYPNGSQTTGFVKSGVVWGSLDGVEFFKVGDLRNVVNYHVFPVHLPVGRTVKYLRLEIGGAYDRAKAAIIGNVVVNGR